MCAWSTWRCKTPEAVLWSSRSSPEASLSSTAHPEAGPSVRDGLSWALRPRLSPFLPQELNRTCRAMQQRVLELIPRVANEQLTEELLIVNDNLNNVFLRHER